MLLVDELWVETFSMMAYDNCLWLSLGAVVCPSSVINCESRWQLLSKTVGGNSRLKLHGQIWTTLPWVIGSCSNCILSWVFRKYNVFWIRDGRKVLTAMTDGKHQWNWTKINSGHHRLPKLVNWPEQNKTI